MQTQQHFYLKMKKTKSDNKTCSPAFSLSTPAHHTHKHTRTRARRERQRESVCVCSANIQNINIE